MFDLAVFITYLRNTGLSRSMADKYGAYARAACNAGQDPTDNAGFASHVASYASSTRARRRSAWRHYQRMLDLELLPDALSHQHTAPTPGVDGFAEWLHNDRGLAESAATAYKSIIRTAIKAVGDTPTREDLEVWLSTRSMSYRARLPTVWRYWRQYNDGQVVDLEVAQNVPDTVAHAAWWLASRCAIRLVDLRAMCWRDIREHDDGTADIRLPSAVAGPKAGELWIGFYDTAIETEIRAGENRGETIVNANVVRMYKRIGSWTGAALKKRVDLKALGAKGRDGGVIVLQAPGHGPIIGAVSFPLSRGNIGKN